MFALLSCFYFWKRGRIKIDGLHIIPLNYDDSKPTLKIKQTNIRKNNDIPFISIGVDYYLEL